MANFQSREPERNDLILLRLPDVEARLPLMTEQERIIVNHHGREVAEITLGGSGAGQPKHFIIRPSGCTPEQLREATELLVLKVPSDGTVFPIEQSGVGGHFVAGVSISIAGHKITLPKALEPRHESILHDDFPAFRSIDDTAIIPVATGVYRSGSLQSDSLSARNSTGSVHASIGVGGRHYNQDLIGAVLPDDGGATLYVLDGNGRRGEIAAKVASELIIRGVEENGSGVSALDQIGPRFGAIIDAQYPFDRTDMGTCAVVADIQAGTVTFAHIGDCRGYLLSKGRDGRYTERHVTRDHSSMQDWIDAGLDPTNIPAMIRHHITRNITADVRGENHSSAEISDPIILRPGDLIVLASDGALLVDFDEILKICNKAGNDTPEKMVEDATQKIDQAVKAKSELGKRADNHSLMIFKYQG